MTRMIIFSIIVVGAIFVFFPSDKIPKSSRQQRLLEASEAGQLETLVAELEEEYQRNPHDLSLLRTKIEAMMYGEEHQFLDRIVEDSSRLAAQSTDMGWFEDFFRTPVPRVREQAIITARRLGWVRLVPRIVELAHDSNVEVKAGATQALVELAPLQERFLLRMACYDSSDNVRATAVTSFQYEMEPVDARRLFRMLSDTSELVRQSSMQTLVKGVHDGVLPAYERHAGDLDTIQGRVALISLANAGNTQALDQLPEIIATAQDMQLPAAAYVLSSQDPATAEALLESLRQEAAQADDDRIVTQRLRAIEALERSLQVVEEEGEGPLAQISGKSLLW